MKTYLNSLSPLNILEIVTHISNVIDIINFTKAYPNLEKLIISIVTYLYSDKKINVDILNIYKFKNIIVSSNNIIIDIKDVLFFLLLKDLEHLKQMNFNIGNFDNIFDTIKFIEAFFKNYLVGKKLYDKTFRFLFTINNSYCNGYAYILDRGYFTFANSNQIRSITDKTYYTLTNDIIYEIEELFFNNLKDYIMYTCIYNKKGYKSYKDGKTIHKNLFDIKVTDHFIKDSLIFLIKGESSEDIYYPHEIIKEWNTINNTNNNITFINQEIINLIIYLYIGKNNLIIKKNKKIYIKIWDDLVFCKYFNKSLFINLLNNDTDESNRLIINQFIDNKVDINELTIFILNHCRPIDFILSKKLHKLTLPCKFSYL